MKNGKLCGDVDFADLEGTASAATPVPGGVGGVTTAVLAQHLVRAARMKQEKIVINKRKKVKRKSNTFPLVFRYNYSKNDSVPVVAPEGPNPLWGGIHG